MGGSDDTSSDFNSILSKFYGGDIGQLLLVATFGYYEPRDAEILEEAGLLYKSYRIDAVNNNPIYFHRRNGRWRQLELPIEPFAAFKQFVEENHRLVQNIVGKIGPRYSGGMFDGSRSDLKMDAIVDEQEANKRGSYYNDPPAECDICSTSFSTEKYMIDGAVQRGAWANMCADCHVQLGGKIGWGSGQLYRRENGGSFKLVAGFRPSDYEDD